MNLALLAVVMLALLCLGLSIWASRSLAELDTGLCHIAYFDADDVGFIGEPQLLDSRVGG